MYKICATKRDLDIIDRKFYRFIPDLWEVVTTIGTYQLKYEDGQYNLYSNDEKTSLSVSSISLIRGCVYEGQDVIVNSNGRTLIGTLKQITQDGEKAVSKSVVFSDSLCSLKSPSQEYVDNRLVREEDIIRPEQVSVYFDSRYLSIEHIKTNGIEILPLQFIPEYIERLPGDSMSSEVQKTQADKSITCSKGDRVIVTKKEGVEYDIVITKVTDYSSLETVLLNNSDVLEFDVNQTVFIEFQIPAKTYTLYTNCGEIHTENASITINSVIDGVSTMLLHGECNEFGDYSVTSIPIQIQPQKVVKIEVEAACSDEIGAPLVYSPSIRNLVTNLELSKTDISSNRQTWTGTFTMPKADCLLSPKVKYIHHDGGQEDINPAFYLTVKSSDLSKVTVNNEEYILTGDPITIPCDVVYLNWELSDGYVSKIDIYSTEYPSDVFYSNTGFSTCKDWVLGSNTTIEISLYQVDCTYKSFRGKISSLDKGKKWNSSNSILDASGDVLNKTYYVDTNVQIEDSGEPSHFEGTEVEEIVFHNPANSFYIHPKAFKKCEHLQSIDLSKTSDIKVKEEAFWGSASLSDFKNTQAISELGEYSFTNTDLPSFTYGSKLLQIPNYAFMNCRDLADVDYESTSSLKSVGRLAFDNCRKLKHTVFPVSLSEIGDQCFGENAFSAVHTIPAYCTETITDSASCVFEVDMEYNNYMTELPKYAFEFCKNIKEAYLPASINLIKKGAFLECNNLTHFISPGLKMLEQGVFSNTWIEDVHNYNNLNSTSYSNVRQKDGTSGIYFEFPFWFDRPKDHYVLIKPDDSKPECILYKRTFPVHAADSRIRPGDDINFKVVGIAEYGFSHTDRWDLVGVNGYTFDAPQVTTVGKYAFKDTNVRSVLLSSNLSYLGEGAFYNCQHLSRVYNMQTWTINEIPNKAFYNCGGVLYGIGSVFDTSGQIADPEFYLPLTTKRIGDFAFYNCKQMMHINNLALCDIEEIGESAFENCFQNQSWRLMNGIRIAVKVIGITAAVIGAFFTVIGTGIAVPDWNFADDFGKLLEWGIDYSSKKYIGQGVGIAIGGAAGAALGTTAAIHVDYFNNGLTKENAKNLTVELLLPKVKKIGPNAFKRCTHLESITVNNKITEIPNGAFQGCEKLVHFGVVDDSFTVYSKTEQSLAQSNVKVIGNNAFSDTCIYQNDVIVNLLLFKAEQIGVEAFSTEGDAILTNASIILPNNVKSIGRAALNPFTRVICPILDFSEKAFVYPFESSRSDQYETTIIIPEGAKSSAQSVSWGANTIKFIEVPLNDNLWKVLKLAGYDISWVTD